MPTATKEKGRKTRGKSAEQTATAPEAPKEGLVKLDLAIVESRFAQLPREAIVQPAEGLTLIRENEHNAVLPALARFPLGYTRTGRLNGKLMNISQYCRMKTGKAWNERHRDAVKDKEGITLEILKVDATRKQLSTELDAMRPGFHMACKSEVARFHARSDVEITSARIRETASGIVVDSKAILPTGRVSEADQLRKELAEKNALVERLSAALPEKTAKRLMKKDKVHEVPATVITQATTPEQIALATAESATANIAQAQEKAAQVNEVK